MNKVDSNNSLKTKIKKNSVCFYTSDSVSEWLKLCNAVPDCNPSVKLPLQQIQNDVNYL